MFSRELNVFCEVELAGSGAGACGPNVTLDCWLLLAVFVLVVPLGSGADFTPGPRPLPPLAWCFLMDCLTLM